MLAASSSSCPAAAAGQPAASGRSTPGLEIAQTISTITGVAISPLMGVGAMGVYKWWHAPKESRSRLAWYAQPWFWGPALFLVVVIGVKDILGAAAPTALKKPFDVAETIENKFSGLLAAGAFLPLIISVFPEAAGGGPEVLNHTPLAAAGFAALDLGGVGNLLLTPFAIAIFAVVWMASHTVNILILLSPFTSLDTVLKSARLAVLSLVAGTSFAYPYLGAALSVALIVAAYFVAGWSLRLTVMGTAFVWDFVTSRKKRFQPGAKANKVFLGKAMEGAPVRSYGKLIKEPTALVFEYRPWLILKKQKFQLPQGEYVVGRGLLYPEIALKEGGALSTRFVLPPRYNDHEEDLARAMGFGPVEDAGMRRGFKAAWRWLRGLFAPDENPEQSAVLTH